MFAADAMSNFMRPHAHPCLTVKTETRSIKTTEGQARSIAHWINSRHWWAHLGDAFVLVVDVNAEPGAALADVLQPGVTRVAVFAHLLARRLALRALVNVHALLAVRTQPQPRPVHGIPHPAQSSILGAILPHKRNRQ